MAKIQLSKYLRPTAEDAALASAILAYPATRSSAAYVCESIATADAATARRARARRAPHSPARRRLSARPAGA